MQRTQTLPPLNATDSESASFNVVIAYQDFETGTLAKKTCDFLANNLGSDCDLTHEMWKFDVLGIPKLRELAVKDACNADIILISSHGEELPAPAIAWIESWLQDGVRAIALVALFDRWQQETPSMRASRDYLAGVARRAGIGFFAQPDGRSGSLHIGRALGAARPIHPSERTVSNLSGMVRRDLSMPRWGINE